MLEKSSEAQVVDGRVAFAKFRTQLALDRTTLAWIRTTLGMTSFGFGMVGFFRSVRQSSPGPETVRLHENAIRFGMALIILGIAATLLAAGSHWLTMSRAVESTVALTSGRPVARAVGPLVHQMV